MWREHHRDLRARKRFGRTWALRECTLAIPAGDVVALVGPNGAGKTTLLNLAAGLLRPTRGRLSVLSGEQPGSAAARSKIGFVAQDAPLYGHLLVRDMLSVARRLNLSWDDDRASARVADSGIPLATRCATCPQDGGRSSPSRSRSPSGPRC